MNKIVLGGIVSVVASLIIAATAWNFSAVAGMPEEYVKKEENTKDHQRIEDKLDKIMDHLLRGER